MSELRRCVGVEVAVPGSLSIISLMVSVDVKHHERRTPGRGTSGGSIPLRLSFLFKSYGLLTLSCDFVSLTIDKILKWLSSLPILMQGLIRWCQ